MKSVQSELFCEAGVTSTEITTKCLSHDLSLPPIGRGNKKTAHPAC